MKAALDVIGASNDFHQGLRNAAANLPSRQRSLPVGVDHADIVPSLQRRERKTDRQGCLATAAFLGCQYDCAHENGS